MVIFIGCVGGFLTCNGTTVCTTVVSLSFEKGLIGDLRISLSHVLTICVGGCKYVYVCINMWEKTSITVWGNVQPYVCVCAPVDAYPFVWALLLRITPVCDWGLMRCVYLSAPCILQPRVSLIRVQVCFLCSPAVEYWGGLVTVPQCIHKYTQFPCLPLI